MKQIHGNKVYVDSVGARSGELDGMMVQVMGEVGIDISENVVDLKIFRINPTNRIVFSKQPDSF